MSLNADQRRNAQIIIQVGQSLGASSRDILIALMTAMQESSLRSGLTEARSDRDSAGLFQQRRPWAPGGSESYRLNPYNAARMFFQGGHGGQRGLFAFKNRNSMSLTKAAQSVQVSAFPNAYARHEATARSLLGMGNIGGQAAMGGGGGSSWIRPVRGGRVTQNFGDPAPRGVTYVNGRKNGMSIAAPHGTPIHAAADGRVVRVTSGGAYGNRVEIEHDGKVWTLYAHLSSIDVRPGMRIRAGAQIGRMGATGQATGSHLHFEVRVGSNQYNSAVNPLTYLNGGGNTTPGIYTRDTTHEFSSTVEGLAENFMSPPEMGLGEANKPYVYSSPADLLEFNTVDMLTSMDPLAPFGADMEADQRREEGLVEDTEPEGTEPVGTLEGVV